MSAIILCINCGKPTDTGTHNIEGDPDTSGRKPIYCLA
jgi:hypothetical protein